MTTKQSIPLIEPYIGKNGRLYVAECFDSNWISSRGHFIVDFEKLFARFVGTKFAVAVSNGTAALHLALVSLGIKEGDEVIVPDLTFAATINAVLHARATPVIVDIDKNTWNISALKVQQAITDKTRAIIPVHLYGYPCDMSEIMKIAQEHHLKVIEDAAEAHGAEVDGRKVGAIGDVGAFSFYGNKIVTTGEGGMCVTNDPNLYDKMIVLRDHGMNRKNRYQYDVIGFNYRMTNPQAALGVAQLEEIEDILKTRDQIAGWYEDELDSAPGITLRKRTKNVRSVSWLFTCLCRNRDELINKMTTEHVETRPMFYPLHTMEIYKKYARGSCGVSIEVAEKGISLPTYYNMPYSFVERVCHLIKSESGSNAR
jgi:perosamine synthetase